MSLPLHASAFAYAGMGCLLKGASGSGKSNVVAQALLHGATFVADDHVTLKTESGALIATASQEIEGVLELHGLGLIRVPEVVASHPIHVVVELMSQSIERLPAPEMMELLGLKLPLLRLPVAPHTPVASLLLYLQAMQEGRILPQDWHPHE